MNLLLQKRRGLSDNCFDLLTVDGLRGGGA